MNERIKRFSEQAINYATSKRPLPDLKDKDLFLNNLFERFAELIVEEIANTAVVSDGMFNGNERRLSVELRLGDMVKKISVFGVEE